MRPSKTSVDTQKVQANTEIVQYNDFLAPTGEKLRFEQCMTPPISSFFQVLQSSSKNIYNEETYKTPVLEFMKEME